MVKAVSEKEKELEKQEGLIGEKKKELSEKQVTLVTMKIADIESLVEEKIPITRMKQTTECDVNYYAWSGSRISTILRNPFYKGAHVVCKTHQKGIRSNTYNIIPGEQREVIEDCHEAIIPKAEWERVQQLIDCRPPIMQGNNCPFYNIFHGIIYCAACGKSMQVRYEKVGRTDKDRRTGKEREPIDKAYYICQTYNRLGKMPAQATRLKRGIYTTSCFRTYRKLRLWR